MPDKTRIAHRTLVRRRIKAAEASGGKSGEPIYCLFERLVEDLELGLDLLDFGAGKGALSVRLYQTGRFAHVTAVDIMHRPEGMDIPLAICWVSVDLNHSIPLSGNSFDAIVAAEVIEHLENPRFVAREWYRLLRPGGWLLISTPNNESVRSILALIFRGHYTDFGEKSYPAHITALLRKDLKRILNEAGFKGPSFHYTNSGKLPKVKFSWQQVSFGILGGLRFSDNLIAIAQKPF